MSRRQPSDTFTRFTSNSIHASQKQPSLRPSPSSQAQPNMAGADAGQAVETPAQKVTRLRAQLQAQRAGSQLSFGDRLVAGGRRVADRMHRVTTYGLLGLTGVSAVVAVYGISSLVTHSRRQKRAFIDAEMDRLRNAQQAFLRGEADAEQLHLLEQERAGEEMASKWKADKDHQKTRGLLARAKAAFGFGEMSTQTQRDMGSETAEEAVRREHRESGGRILEEAWAQQNVRPAAVAKSDIQGVGYDSKGRPVPLNKLEQLPSKIKIERRTGEQAMEQAGVQGGPLDQLAGGVASAATSQNTSGGWYSSWFDSKS